MGTIQTAAEALRADGHTVHPRGHGPGSAEGVTDVRTKLTGTTASSEGSQDLNDSVLPAGGVAYVQRDGTVWLVGEGPTDGTVAEVWVAAVSKGKVSGKQKAAVDRVVAVLCGAFGLDEPEKDPDEDEP